NGTRWQWGAGWRPVGPGHEGRTPSRHGVTPRRADPAPGEGGTVRCRWAARSCRTSRSTNEAGAHGALPYTGPKRADLSGNGAGVCAEVDTELGWVGRIGESRSVQGEGADRVVCLSCRRELRGDFADQAGK